MGNLAERYQDRARSGLYRVSSARVPLDAAREAQADLNEIQAAELGISLGRADREGKNLGPFSRIWIVHGAQQGHLDLARNLLDEMQAQLRPGDPCFVILVDPLRQFDLPTLWKEPPVSFSEIPCATAKGASRTPA